MITEILDSLGVPWADSSHRHGRAGWVQVNCPRCDGGANLRHLGINLAHGYANCWRCGRANLVDVVTYHSPQPPQAVRAALQGLRWQPAAQVVPTGTYTPPRGVGPLAGAHKRYLRGRGYCPDTLVRLWSVGGLGMDAPRVYRWRLFIPHYHHGQPVTWTTRAIGDGMRWRAAQADAEAAPAKHLLYGSDYARAAVVVHEGHTDVWATGPGAVGVGGLGYTRAQVLALTAYPHRVICFDSTPDAQARARQLASELAVFPGRTEQVVLDTGDDASDADPDEVAELRAYVFGG